MIELAIFGKKGDFTKTNGDAVVDLTRRSVSFRGVTVNQGKTYVVEEGLQMRGDLISKIFYQTSSFLCLLLKYNGISNPFAIDVNDILKMPDGSVLSSMLATPDTINGSNNNWTTSTRKKKKPQFIKPATKQDQKRLDYLTTKYGTAVAPTTAAKDTSVKITNGKVVFGSGVTSIKKEDCPDPISRTKLLATLLKNKING
jgi:hypothetical protein